MRKHNNWDLALEHIHIQSHFLSFLLYSRLFEESSGDFLDSQCVDCFLQDVYLHGHDHIGQYSERGGIVHIGNGVGGYDTHNAFADKDTIWFK